MADKTQLKKTAIVDIHPLIELRLPGKQTLIKNAPNGNNTAANEQ